MIKYLSVKGNDSFNMYQEVSAFVKVQFIIDTI